VAVKTSSKILYTATSDIHLKTFHIPYLKWLKEQGVEVHLAIEKRGDIDLGFCDAFHYLPFKRSPLHLKNVVNFFLLRKLIKKHSYSLIHCHTPTVSVLTRLAAFFSGNGQAAVLYTAHGFHFYKGAPWHLWALYYPVEKMLSIITNGIITINEEDYTLVKRRFWNKHTYKINGVGVNTERFKTVAPQARESLREKHGFASTDFVLLYVAEFIPRKNHQFLLEAIQGLQNFIPTLQVALIGKGVLVERMRSLASNLKVEQSIRFLGWRDDVEEFAALADVGISTSKQEGLGLGLAEEMLCSIPVVASVDRGHKEMIDHGVNGFMYRQGSHDDFINCVRKLYEDVQYRHEAGKNAAVKAQQFVLEKSLQDMAAIYQAYLRSNY
jgi:glycosyltransferase EpsD